MKKTILGASGIEVPIICLGSMNWGTYNTEPEAHAQLDYAISQGVNFIDTAEVYPIPPTTKTQGLTEKYIGTWLHKRGQRDDLIIASKVCVGSTITTRQQKSPPSYDARSIKDAVDGSLQRLQTDYIDVYQIHWPERETNFFGKRGYKHNPDHDFVEFEKVLETMQELITMGKIRAVGVSNETPWGVSEYLRLTREKKLPHITSIQNQYSLINRTFEIGLSEFSIRENVPLLAYSPLSFGVLTGKYLADAKPAGARFTVHTRSQERYNTRAAQPAIEQYVELARKHNLDPATLAIAFACSREFVGSVIIGATSLDQLKVNIAAGSIQLSDEILAGINDIYTAIPDPTV